MTTMTTGVREAEERRSRRIPLSQLSHEASTSLTGRTEKGGRRRKWGWLVRVRRRDANAEYTRRGARAAAAGLGAHSCPRWAEEGHYRGVAGPACNRGHHRSTLL